MEVTFTLKVACDISDIESHGVEREIELVVKALKDASIRGIESHVSAYRIDSVIAGEQTMLLEQATMKLSKMGVVTEGLPVKVPKMVLLWKKVGLAIHRSEYIGDRGLWIISHFNSGRAVLKYIKTKEQAVEYLRRLCEILEDWTFTEEEWNARTDESKKEVKKQMTDFQKETLKEMM